MSNEHRPDSQEDEIVRALIAAAKTGHTDSIGKLLETCRPSLLRFARASMGKVLQGKVGGSDIVQETMLNAVRAFESFRGEHGREMLAWLERILTNKILEIARRTGDVNLKGGLDLLDGDDVQRCFCDGPRQLAEKSEIASILQSTIQRLPSVYQQVIHQRVVESRSYHEIGDTLKCSPDAARMLFVRALQRLRNELPSQL